VVVTLNQPALTGNDGEGEKSQLTELIEAASKNGGFGRLTFRNNLRRFFLFLFLIN
jgi:hypothetical protein